jgi:hypothetical protein
MPLNPSLSFGGSQPRFLGSWGTFRCLLVFFTLTACGCVLEHSEDRRPEIAPGRYVATNDDISVTYDFRSDSSFTFVRTVSGRQTITESGKWECRYHGPEDRFLVESEVIRKDFASDGTWIEKTGLQYNYRIVASSSKEFHLDPGATDLPGLFTLLLIFAGSNHVVFIRQ